MSVLKQVPSVGRMVHYQAFGTPGGEHPSVPRAAIVTAVHSDECVSLCVLNPAGMFFSQSTNYDGSESPKGGTWHWPPFVAPKEVSK